MRKRFSNNWPLIVAAMAVVAAVVIFIVNLSINPRNIIDDEDSVAPVSTTIDLNCPNAETLSHLADQLLTVDSIPSVEISVAGGLDTSHGVRNYGLSFSMSDDENSNNNYTDLGGRINTRGFTTYYFGSYFDETYPYKIKLEEPVNFFGFGEHKEWVLLPNIVDRSAIRQFYFSNLGQLFMCEGNYFSPKSAYVELYLEGEYKGLYLLMESIEENEGRLGIENNYSSDALEVPFLVELENGRMFRLWSPDPKDNDFFMIDDPATPCTEWPELQGARTTDTMITLEYPGSFSDVSDVQGAYIKKTVSDLYKNARNHVPYVDLGIDTASFVNYFLYNELFINQGLGSSSTFMYKPAGGKITMGPFWDFDGMVMVDSGSGFIGSNEWCDANIYRNLLRYDEFRSALYDRLLWFEQNLLPIAEAKLDALEANKTLQNAVMRNQDKHPTWGADFGFSTGKYFPKEIINATTWEQHIQQLRGVLFDDIKIDNETYAGRTQWLIQHFEELQYWAQ